MLFSLYRIHGHSMQPTFFPGDIVVISSLPYFFTNPKINDLVVCIKNHQRLIKRITKIEKNTYEVLGDNSKDSMDSKHFGLLTKKEIIGKVIYRVSSQ